MRVCFVPGCKTRNGVNPDLEISGGTENARKLSMFCATKADMVERWSKAINHKRKIFTAKRYVCELHFAQEDLMKEFMVPLNDGVIFKMQKQRISLKQHAVPCISNLSGNQTSLIPVTTPTTDSSIKSDAVLTQNWDKLNLSNIKKPSQYWFEGKVINNKLFFTSIKHDLYSNGKTVVFGHNSVEVLYNNKLLEIEPIEYNHLLTESCIEQILKKIEEMPVCYDSGGSERSLLRDNSTQKMCKNYKASHKLVLKRIAYQQKMKNIKGLMKNTIRKNLRLKSKVLNLRNQMQSLMLKRVKYYEHIVRATLVK